MPEITKDPQQTHRELMEYAKKSWLDSEIQEPGTDYTDEAMVFAENILAVQRTFICDMIRGMMIGGPGKQSDCEQIIRRIQEI
jgi:hypothetical protein